MCVSCRCKQVIAQGKRDSSEPTLEFYCNFDIFDLNRNRPFFLLVESHPPKTPMAIRRTRISMPFEPFQYNGQCDRGQPHQALERRLHCYSHTRSDMYTAGSYSDSKISRQFTRKPFRSHPKLTKQCSWWKISKYPMTSPPNSALTWT